MRSLTYLAPGRLEWREVPEPRLQGPGEALVEPLAVATCDLDSVMIAGQSPFPAPIALGHECVGRVVEVGEQVSSFRPGDVVVVPFQISCGSCAACRSGHTGNCRTVPLLSMYGFGAAGGDWGGALSERLRVPYAEAMLVALPDALSPQAVASAADNITDGWRTVAAPLRDQPGADVLVVGGGGSGSIGLYAAGLAGALGAGQVDYLDSAPDRLERAARLGANPIEADYSRRPRAQRYPITVEASGEEEGLILALRCTERDGVCTSASVHLNAQRPLPLIEMYTTCTTLHIGRCHARAGIPEVLALLAEGRLHPELVTERVVPWDQAAEALAEHDRKHVVVREPA